MPTFPDDPDIPEYLVEDEDNIPNERMVSGEVEYDGRLLYTISDRLVASAATVRFGYFVAPCAGIIQFMGVNCIVSPTHATNDLSFGLVSDIDSHLNEVDITDLATGFIDYTGHANILSRTIAQGAVYAWGWVGGDTTGEIVTTMVISPT
jgi:hypothetical protein